MRANPPCKCGRGIASRFDGKCGHCRTRRERIDYGKWLNRPAPPVIPTLVWDVAARAYREKEPT